ncbi:MAG: hypothetical protein AAF587_41800 [Bacteroidota bacterium]
MFIRILLIFLASIFSFSCTHQPSESSASVTDPRTEEAALLPADLKGSLVEKLYDRKLLLLEGNQLEIQIPFDLHDPGGLAADCYITELRLAWELKGELSFPRILPFEEREYGDCVDQEFREQGEFQLAGQSTTSLTYRSENPQRCLMIFRDHVYYFVDVALDGVGGENIEEILSTFNEEAANDNMHVPYRSSAIEKPEES